MSRKYFSSQLLMIIYLVTLVQMKASADINGNYLSENSKEAVRLSLASPMNPHDPNRKGPWFEGWYYRFLDPNTKKTFAVLAGSFLAKGKSYIKGQSFPGYLAVVTPDESGRLQVYDIHLATTNILRHGLPLGDEETSDGTTDFEWSSPGLGSITHNAIDIEFSGVKVRAQINEILPWDKSFPNWGPEGIGAYFGLMPLHWHVHSLGSSAIYEMSIDRNHQQQTIAGHAWAHQEKNWGNAFPRGWIWLQGMNPENDVQIALAGGEIPVVNAESWLAGFRSKEVDASFSPAEIGTKYKQSIDACKGYFRLEATNREQVMVVEAQAPPETFGNLAIPTENGFVPGALESFKAKISVSIYVRGWGQHRLIKHYQLEDAALEFGADYSCKKN